MHSESTRSPAIRAFRWTLLAAAAIHVLGLIAVIMSRARGLTEVEVGVQHFNVFHVLFDRHGVSGVGFSGAALLLALLAMRSKRLGLLSVRWLADSAQRRVWLIAACAVVVSWLGGFTVYLDFPLSMDEFGAQLQARIFASGTLTAPIPAEWLPYADAATPIFVERVDGTHWISNYLPVYALLRACFLLIHLDSLLNPLLIGLSIVLVAAIAGRLMPQQREAPLLAALSLATSSQLLINGMSSYSMPAHLAFNLLWLWLYLLDTRRAWVGVAVVGVLAMGLHQFVMHPLFAAPFLFRLVLRRRWLLSLALAGTYLGALAGWIAWTRATRDGLAEGVMATWGLPRGAQSFDQLINLVEVVTWQAPVVAVLALAALFALRHSRPEFLDMAVSCMCTFFLYVFFLRTQGHGWGYRYFFPVLGNLCLLAAFGWAWLAKYLGRRPLAAFACTGLVAAALIQLPNRMLQVREFVAPFAHSYEHIQAQSTDVVVVDRYANWYAQDLIRTDPLFLDGPVVLNSLKLTSADLEALRNTHSVTVLMPADFRQFGLLNTADDPLQIRLRTSQGNESLPRR